MAAQASSVDSDNPNDIPSGQLGAHQQVMSPRGAPADARPTAALPNGVPPQARRAETASNDAGFEQDLGAAMHLGSRQDGSSMQADVRRDVRASDEGRVAETAPAHREDGDRLLLPHANTSTSTFTMPMRASTAAQLFPPSPFPSPMDGSQGSDVASATGLSFMQQGAAAMRWFSRLGEYVQRRATAHTRPTGEATTVVEETTWSPNRARSAESEGEPLFSGRQLRRLRELEGQAPQLYGATMTAAGGASSETSGSYSKEQLESEVRKQVEAAMASQRGLVDENQRLRQELEMLKASVRSSPGEVETATRRDVVHGDIGAPPALTVLDSRTPSNNPTGLSGHSRDHGGQAGLSDLAKVPSGNLAGRPGHDDQRPGEGGRLHGGLEGNLAGLMGHGGGIREGAEVATYNLEGMSMKDVLNREVEGLRGKNVHVSGGNLSGLSERGGEPRGRVSFQGDDGDPGENRVPSNNPAGLSGHSRRAGHYVNMQYASSTSGPLKQQYASSTSGPTTWNPLGIGGGIKNQAGENEAGLKGDGPKFGEGLVASPMEALLKGMSQLHQAMTLQLDRQSNKPEAIRPGITGSELPKLPEADEYAAINVGDWLHGLTGPMGDLTDGSGGWWADVMRSLDDYYKEYLAATTVRKVQLKAEDFAHPGVREERWARVDKRAASMLLQAVPEAIKSELMANRLSTTLAILGRILTIYRPGSSVERQQVLKALESPGVGGSPMDLVEILHKWARWLKRAEDLGLQPPDASILLKGLDVATKPLMEKNNEIFFRTNMLRFSLDLDAAPTKTAVLRFHGHLLAEFEQLAYRGRGKGGPTVSAAVRAANATGDAGTSPTSTQKGGSSPSASASARPCKFFAQESGCQRLNCKFAHDWANIPKEEKSERCKNCGAKGHMKRQCPLRASSDGGRKGEEGKGSAGPKVRATMASTNKGSDGKRDDGTVPGGEVPQSSSTTSAATTASTAEAGVSAASIASGARGSAGEIDDFLKNATQILKMMTEKQGAQQAQGPSMKMLKKAVRRFENRLALVDSGATHPLREARPDEWAEAPEVDVVIAGDGVTTMRQAEHGGHVAY